MCQIQMLNIYRKGAPSGKYDMLIVSLVHQNSGMIRYIVKNLEKYVRGSFIWIAHYNGSDPVDEETLPQWA